MEEPLYFIRREHRKQIREIIQFYTLREEDFDLSTVASAHYYKLKKEPRLYFVFEQHSNNLDKFFNKCTKFTPQFTLTSYCQHGTSLPQYVIIEEAVHRFENWLKSELIPYLNEMTELLQERASSKKLLEQIEKDNPPNIQSDFYEPISHKGMLKIDEKKGAEKEDYLAKQTLDQTLKQNTELRKRLDSALADVKRFNAIRIETMDTQANNPKYLKLLKISIFFFLSYIIGTSHLILKMNFNWLVFATVEFLLVIGYLYVIFQEPAEKRSLVSQTVVGAFLVLFGMLAYKLLQ